MPYLQFNRTASLAIGPGSEQGIAFRDFRIVFEVEKTDTTDSNKANISIYNLSEATRNKIKKDDVVLLNAGYVEGYGEELLFAGNITRVSHAKDGAEVVTKIAAADGIKLLREIKIAKSYAEGTKAKAVLFDLISIYRSNGISTRTIPEDIDENAEYVAALALLGLIKDAMDRVCFRLSLSWVINNNSLTITHEDESDKTRAIVLTSTSGLIGIPERDEDIGDKPNKEKAKNGWKFKALLQPKLQPKGLIQVSSVEVGQNKIFRVTSIKHSGDTEGEEWSSSIEAVSNE